MKRFIVANWFESLVLFFIISIFYNTKLPNIILLCLILIFSVNFFHNKITISIKAQIPFGILFLFLIVKAIFNQNFIEEFNSISKYFIILVIPLTLIKIEINKLKIILFCTSLSVIIFSIFNILIYYFEHKTFPFGNGLEPNKILILERPYMGFICLIAVLLAFDLLKKTPRFKTTLVVIIFLITTFIFLIAARLSFISLFFILILYLFKESRFSLFKKSIVIFTSISIIYLCVNNIKSLTDRFFLTANLETFIDYEPRFVIWNCAKSITKQPSFSYFTGFTSEIETQNELNECYNSKIENISKRNWYAFKKYNTHNQFICFFLKGGLIAICLFIAYLFILTRFSWNNFFSLSLLFSLILFLFMENVLQRQFGCYISALILTLILKREDEKN